MQVAFSVYTDKVVKGAKKFTHDVDTGSSHLIIRGMAKYKCSLLESEIVDYPQPACVFAFRALFP